MQKRSIHSFIIPFLQGSEFDGDSKTLADFISLMLKNSKSRDQIIQELSEIIGSEIALDLTDRLMDWIRSNSIDVHAEVGSTRILGAALKQAIESEPASASANSGKRSRDEEIQEPKKQLKIRDRLGPLVSERLGNRGSKDHVENTRQKCSFWPNCKRPECTFIHPTKMCSDGDDCTRGDQCTFIHLSDLKGTVKNDMEAVNNQTSLMSSNTMIPCKFGINCLKPDCPFGHPSAPSSVFIQQKSTILCKFDTHCLKPACPFSHPSRTAIQQGISTTDKSLVQCKYDPFCARPGCLFKHSPKDQVLTPSQKFLSESIDTGSPIIITSPNGHFFPGSVPQGQPGRFKNKSLILKTSHISQRGFAVSDGETEKFDMQVE